MFDVTTLEHLRTLTGVGALMLISMESRNRGLMLAHVTHAELVNLLYLEIVFAFLWDWTVLGASFSYYSMSGCIVIIMSTVLLQYAAAGEK